MGRGRGTHVPWRYNAIPFADGVATEEDELADTGSSPIKKGDADMENSESSDPGTKRRLEFDNSLLEDETLPQNLENLAVAMITDGTEIPLANEGDDIRTKRSRKAGANSPSLGSAGSFEGPVRSQ
jgi:hypothetical protein